MGFLSKVGAVISGTFSFVKEIFTSDVREGTEDKTPKYSSSSCYISPPTYPTSYLSFTSSYPDYGGYTSPRSYEYIPPTVPAQTIKFVQTPVTFLQMQQLDEFPLPRSILAIECGEVNSQSTDEMIE